MTYYNPIIRLVCKDFEVFLTKEANGKHFQKIFSSYRCTIACRYEFKRHKLKSQKFRWPYLSWNFFLNLWPIMDVILVISPSHLDSYLVIESKRSEMSIVLFFVGIFSKEGLSLVEIAVAIGVSTTVISLQNVTIRPATCRNMSEPLINNEKLKACFEIGTVYMESFLSTIDDAHWY